MYLLFNTIMLEPNRWTADHVLTYPLMDLLRPVRAAGFEALEIWQYHLSELDQRRLGDLGHALGELGMRAMVIGAYPALHESEGEWETTADQLDRLIDYGRRLGMTTLKVFAGRVASADAGDDVRAASVARLEWLAARLAQHGLQLTMETHGNTLCDTVSSSLQLLDELSAHDNVGICFQPYTDHDTDAALTAYDGLRGRVRHVHLQNRQGQGRAVSLLAEGDWIDYARFLPHLRASGFDELMCIEFTAGITPAPGESFDVHGVIDNAAADADFTRRAWGPNP